MGGFRQFIKSQRRISSWDDEERGSQTETNEEYAEQTEREEVEEEDLGDEFTMEIMLKMAGVEERLIGWDRELNNFIKK
jgi:hypothetical protein